MRRWRQLAILGAAFALLFCAWTHAARAVSPVFEVQLAERLGKQPRSGRLFVFCSKEARGEPRLGPNWFEPEPFFARNVKAFAAGAIEKLDDAADAFPEPLSKLPLGTYRLQAVFDQKFDHQHHGLAAGNCTSGVAIWKHDGQTAPPRLVLDQVIEPSPFPSGRFIQLVTLKSAQLSQFHGRDVEHVAAVVLPKNYYDKPERRYPVLFIIPGFSGSERDALRYPEEGMPSVKGEADLIRVMLSGQCAWGHHVYADSATNGPRGTSFVEEFIPHIDATYRTIAAPTARFLNGHSSGGWSSLWLQVRYPDTFGGVWSTSPDPVDFRDFQRVNLYADPPQNMYVDPRGERRPLARFGDQVVLWYDRFAKMDDVLGGGGQLRSFEAVFSPLDADGEPRRMWNRATGQVDPEVAQAWQAYDINLILQRNWPTLGPKLRGKLHIYMGDSDTFYLEGATIKLKETLERLESDAIVTIDPGVDHRPPARWQKEIRAGITAAFLRAHGSK